MTKNGVNKKTKEIIAAMDLRWVCIDIANGYSEHFVDFVRDYFKFLEAGRLTLDVTINYIALETNTSAYILN